NTAQRAFAHWLVEHHPGFAGPSICSADGAAREANRGHAVCVAEIHKGRHYLQVWATASHGPRVAFTYVSTRSWTRRWSKYSRTHPKLYSPGLVSVNAWGSFDWRWLVLGVDYFCRQKHHNSCSAGALDGPWGGPPIIFTFFCHTDGQLIACHNRLGDALR